MFCAIAERVRYPNKFTGIKSVGEKKGARGKKTSGKKKRKEKRSRNSVLSGSWNPWSNLQATILICNTTTNLLCSVVFVHMLDFICTSADISVLWFLSLISFHFQKVIIPGAVFTNKPIVRGCHHMVGTRRSQTKIWAIVTAILFTPSCMEVSNTSFKHSW